MTNQRIQEIQTRLAEIYSMLLTDISREYFTSLTSEMHALEKQLEDLTTTKRLEKVYMDSYSILKS